MKINKDQSSKVPPTQGTHRETNRQLIFKIILICTPFMFLIMLEIILRISGYGFSTSLFTKDIKLSGYYSMNPEIGKLFFVNLKEMPAVLNEPFKKVKPGNTYRIFVLGESTAIGYPYIPNGSFHRMLKYRLDRTFPDKNIEIISLAMTGISSYTLLYFTDEMIELNPDVILIYTGHNEYYGALGVASQERLGIIRGIIKMVMQFKKSMVV